MASIIQKIQEVVVNALTKDSMHQVFGNRGTIESEKRNRFNELLAKMLPDLQAIADETIGQVTSQLELAQVASNRAEAFAQSAEATVNLAEERLHEIEGVVAEAKSQARVAQKHAEDSASRLSDAKARFAALVSE